MQATAQSAGAQNPPLALDGTVARVGVLGRWLCEPTDVISAPAADAADASPLLLSFPRDWPEAFKSIKLLRSLINRTLKGTRCRAVATPPTGTDGAAALAAAVKARPLHSFVNAQQLAAALDGWGVVKGFVVLERSDAPAGTSFVAIRHWWNVAPSGGWVDLSPLTPCGGGRRLLVESAGGEKEEAALTHAGLDFALRLTERLAGRTGAEAAAEAEAGARIEAAAPLTASAASDASVRLAREAAAAKELTAKELEAMVEVAEEADEPGEAQVARAMAATARAAATAAREAAQRAEAAAKAGPRPAAAPPAESATGAEAVGEAVGGAPPSPGSGDHVGYHGDAGNGGEELELVEQPAHVVPPIVPARQQPTGPHAAALSEANGLYRAGDWKAAAPIYERVATLVAAEAGVHKVKGNEAFQQAALEPALRSYEAGLCLLGHDVSRVNYNSDQAAAEYSRALRDATPKALLYSLHSNRAACLLGLERWADAEVAASAALKERPADVKARLRRAKARRALGLSAAACSDYAYVMLHQLAPSATAAPEQRAEHQEPAAAPPPPSVRLGGEPSAAAVETVHLLVASWVERAPLLADFVREVRAAAERQGGSRAVDAAMVALCRALHGKGAHAGEWAREAASRAAAAAAAARARKSGHGAQAPALAGSALNQGSWRY